MRRLRLEPKPGQILILAIVFMAVVLILSASLFGNVSTFLRLGARSIQREQASTMAEAGLDYTVWQLNKTAGSFTPPAAETKIGVSGSFITTITNQTSSLKTVTSTGYVPNATNPQAKRTIKADVFSGQGLSFRYAVQVGSGGVDMSQSSTINGNVYSNGSITAGSGNQQTIDGEAWAVGTIDSPDPIEVTQPPPHPSASPEPLPDISQIVSDAKTAAEAGGTTTCSPTCTVIDDGDIGPQKYVGNLEITNNAEVTMKGPIWVTGVSGNFFMSQGRTILKLDDNFGSNNVALIVDGTIDLTQGGALQPTNGTPKGYIMLVTTSTSSQAVKISQSGTTAIFYALDGTAELSQTASVTSLVAKTLIMGQTSTLNYDSGLASANFTTGPGASWQLKKGTYRYTSNP